MARSKSGKLTAWQKLLTVMISGKEITVDEIETTLGKEIHMYRLSTYIWDIKSIANGVIKAVKSGRKVVAYQLINVDEMKEYMNRTGITNASFVPGQEVKKPSISKLADLSAKPAKMTPSKKVKPVKEKVEDVAEVTVEEVTEVTE
jgi:hypothetical protein